MMDGAPETTARSREPLPPARRWGRGESCTAIYQLAPLGKSILSTLAPPLKSEDAKKTYFRVLHGGIKDSRVRTPCDPSTDEAPHKCSFLLMLHGLAG